MYNNYNGWVNYSVGMLQGLQKVVSPEIGLVVCRFSFWNVNVCGGCVVTREDYPTLEKFRRNWFERFGKSEIWNRTGIVQGAVDKSHIVEGLRMSATGFCSWGGLIYLYIYIHKHYNEQFIHVLYVWYCFTAC